MSQPVSDVGANQMAPHSVEAEQAVIGSLLVNASVLPVVASYITEQDFFIVRHGWIYEAVLALNRREEPIDYLTIAEEVERSGRLSEAGGQAYLLHLIDETPSALNVEGYAVIVQRMALRRRLLSGAQRVAQIAHRDDKDITEVVSESESAIMDAVKSARIKGASTGRQLADRHYERRQMIASSGRDFVGLATGFIDMDRLLGGLKDGNLITVAGRPGMAKTSLLLAIARAALEAGTPTGILSYEMTEDELVTRLHVANTGLSFDTISNGRFDETQASLYANSTQKVADWPIYIDDDVTDKSVEAARMKARGMAFEFGIRVLIVDYLQLMTAKGFSGGDNRVQEVGAITAGLKGIARELGIPVIAAAQVNRAVEQRADKRPTLSDLRESGSIENDSDLVMLLYRDAYYDPDTPDGNRSEIQIAKHRNGPTGVIDLIWMPQTMTFVNATRANIDLNNYGNGNGRKPQSAADPELDAALGMTKRVGVDY